jgi:hypothetical protein
MDIILLLLGWTGKLCASAGREAYQKKESIRKLRVSQGLRSVHLRGEEEKYIQSVNRL